MSVATTNEHSSVFTLCVCYVFNHYRHYSSQVILTQHLRGLQKLRGRGHSSAQLWQITINSMLQTAPVFKGKTMLWGTFTLHSQLSQELPEGYPKNLSPYFIGTKKPQLCSTCEQMLFHPPFQQLLDTSEHSLHQQDQRDASLCPQLVAGQPCAADLHLLPAPFQTPWCQLSWTSFLDAFWLP